MAADAAHVFARHPDRPRPHQLDGPPFRVERLDGDGTVHRRVEEHAAVRRHRRGAQNVFHVVRRLHAGAFMSRRMVKPVMIRKEAHFLHRAARHALEALALIDVAAIHRAIRHVLAAAVGYGRRTLPRLERDRFVEVPVLGLVKQRDVVEYVHKIDSPQRARRRLH